MDKYDPIRILGEGSFGKVYLMRDKIRRKFVCVKIIKIKNIPKKEREATKMEVDLLRRLHHPNIVRYIDSFLSNNNESLCISMEYCDGGDLASQIKNARRKLFSEDKVLHWFVQISLGLHYMHSNKVLHRDLKTQNIFLLGNGRLVLGDLGISKVLEGTMDFAQTCIGTPYYMSPEIFKNKPYSYKSDVWALGCVLYEMTTLNHAFDANSINGLAQKIIKGKYPPIHNKYSRYLRELIAQMLAPEPKQRPDLDQILRKPFIRKHVMSFFVEIASRPSTSLGEGTMIVRAAAGAGGGSAAVNDANAIALRQQLEVLGMQKELQEALNPKASPADPVEAQKMVKEQATQLRREEEHRKMVEAALERLRLERENRARERASMGGAPAGPSKPSAAPAAAAAAAPQRDYGLPGSKFPVQQPQVQRAAPAAPASVRDGGLGPSAYPRRDPAAEQRRLSDERARLEAEAEERRQQQQRDLEAHQRAEQRAQAAEALLKQKREAALKAQAERDQVARREQQRLAERERQNAEIEQLKIFKDEMDRKQREKDMITERRRQEERRKIEEYRRSGSEIEQDFKEVPSARPPRVTREPSYRAEDKDDISARDKMMQRRLEKQAREDMERIEALKEVADENRRIRAQAYEHHRNIWHGNNGAPPAAAPADETVRAGARVRSRSPVVAEDKASGYQFEAEGRARRNVGSGLDMDEMTARLNEIAPAGRFEVPRQRSSLGADDDILLSDEDSEDDIKVPVGGEAPEEELEDMHQREVELQEELQMATLRCQELKQTLQATRSYIESRGGGAAQARPGPKPTRLDVGASSEDEDDDAFEYDENELNEDLEDESTEDTPPPSYAIGRSETKESKDYDITPRVSSKNVAIKPSPYQNLQDPPTPTGKLADRIKRLRSRCIDALGQAVFDKAHSFLVQFDDNDQFGGSGDSEEEKVERMQSILGPGKVHYMPLIEQLIFMEATHSG